MEVRKMHIPIGKLRPGIKTTMESITIHNTGNPRSTALNERAWLVNPSNNRVASWHIAIDERMAVEAIPLDEVAWHAANRQGNYSSIGIEVCESGNQAVVRRNAAQFVAGMLHGYGWDVDRVTTHRRWSGANCPRLLLPIWEEFINMIREELAILRESGKYPRDLSEWARAGWQFVKKYGISDGERPKDTVSREEMWTMLERLHRLGENDGK